MDWCNVKFDGLPAFTDNKSAKFHFSTSNTTQDKERDWSGNLKECKCLTCDQNTLVYPFCYKCLMKKTGLDIKQTQILKKTGGTDRMEFLGLFATRDFAKNVDIVPYVGELLDFNRCKKRYGTPFYNQSFRGPYLMISGKQGKLVDSVLVRSLGAFVNTGYSNVTISPHWSRFPKLCSTRAIKAGEELYLNYGLASTTHSTTVDNDHSYQAFLDYYKNQGKPDPIHTEAKKFVAPPGKQLRTVN